MGDIIPERDAELAQRFGKSKVQRDAVVKALAAFREEVVGESRDPDTVLGSPVEPQSPVVVFVLSGRGVGPRDNEQVRQDLTYIASRAGQPIHVVTAGRMGAELEARKWAASRAHLTEFGAVWAIPHVDGSTSRDPNARAPRNKRLREFAARAKAAQGRCFVLLYGTEDARDEIEEMLVRAGAQPSKRSRFYRDVAAPVDMVDDAEPGVAPEPVDPGDLAAGQPDVEHVAADPEAVASS